MSSLKNKKIIISAGASGIGWATAKVCLDKGATVFICDIDEKYLKKIKIKFEKFILKHKKMKPCPVVLRFSTAFGQAHQEHVVEYEGR